MQKPSVRQRIANWIAGTPQPGPTSLAISARVDDSPGWGNLSTRPHDYDTAKVQELYADALEAWRKNPLAWRIIAITTNYTVGDHLSISSPNRMLNKFIKNFWSHPKNRMELRLESMSDELARAGDLFIALFRNPGDGMSYIRLVTKDRIVRIECAPNDWETELYFYEQLETGETRRWLSPAATDGLDEPAVMLHYAINRPAGALLGESDLTTMLPWLLRYSRMLEDRVRLNWAVRAFLWLVTVPASKVREKQEFYRTQPEAGSIVVKDESEKWEVMTPELRASDASADLKAVRQMVDAGSGYPPHWRGEPENANLATAEAMQEPTERHLIRRQKYFCFMLQDILYQAYQRAAQVSLTRPLANTDYDQLFTIEAPDVSRRDNEALASSSQAITSAFMNLVNTILPKADQASVPPLLIKRIIQLAFQHAGAPITEDELQQIINNLLATPAPKPKEPNNEPTPPA
ncbi:MAG: hypothetical protein AB1894_15740 [Chloroflexota bacterium]